MKFYSITEEPLKLYGLAVADAVKRRYWRISEEIIKEMPQYERLGKRCVGGRVRFCTDSPSITIKMTLVSVTPDICVPLSGASGADVYLGKGKGARFIGYISPLVYSEQEFTVEKTFYKGTEMELVTINLPRNDHLLGLEVGIEDEAQIKEAPEYTVKKPIVFYGSSITEGGCALRVGNAYTSLVSRWLDADYYNFGFSGSARGEEVFADYIGNMGEISAFVYDYDHNAHTPEHLEATHEKFFKIIRKAYPNVPMLFMTKPDVDWYPEDAKERREIIYRTYMNAKGAGDEKVWFLDGGTFFGEEGRSECTVDGTHPTDLGFTKMAQSVYPVLKEMLEL